MKGRWSYWRIPFMCVLAALCALAMFVARPQAAPAGLWATPTPMPTPTLPPPVVTPEPTPVFGAVTICADGKAVCTLLGEEDAQELQIWQLEQAEAMTPENEELMMSGFRQQITTRSAIVGEVPMTLDDAKASFTQNAALLPTYIETRTVEVEPIPFATEQEEDARIPYGARIVRQVGRTGAHTIITRRTYENGEPVGDPVVEESKIEPMEEDIAVGTYLAANPYVKVGRSEGVRGRAGPEGFPLHAPVEGNIKSYFGTRDEEMNYGLDFSCVVGEAVFAPGAGTVMFAKPRGSYGLVVEIDHGDGFVSRIAPLKDVEIKEGDLVERGQQIGTMAAPLDDELEPHLHFELLIDGIPYNPLQYLD